MGMQMAQPFNRSTAWEGPEVQTCHQRDLVSATLLTVVGEKKEVQGFFLAPGGRVKIKFDFRGTCLFLSMET